MFERRWVRFGFGFGCLACGGAAAPAATSVSPTPVAEKASPPNQDVAKLAEARQLAARAKQLMATQRQREAADTATRALALLSSGNPEDDRLLFELELIRGDAFRYGQDLPRALPAFEAALAAAQRHEGVSSAQVVEATLRRTETLRALHRGPAALELLERTLQVVDGDPKRVGETFQVASALIVLHHESGSAARAKDLLSRYVTTARRLDPKSQVVSDTDALAVFDPPKLPPPPPALPAGNARIAAPPAATNSVDPSSNGSSSASFALDESPSAAESTSSSSAVAESKAANTGDVSNAALVVAAMRAGFRSCYQRALAEDASTQGIVRLTLRIGGDGHVTDVRGASLGLRATAVDCLLRRAGESVFNPREGGSAQIAVPVTFVKQ